MRKSGGLQAMAVAAVLAMPAAAHAQYAAYVFTPEVYYGVGLGAEFIGNNSDLDACGAEAGGTGDYCQTITDLTGGGFEAFVGLRLGEWIGVEAGYDAFFHTGSDENPYNLATLQSLRADLKVFFLAGSGLEPYVSAGGGLYLIGDEYGVGNVGGGFQLGAGLDVYLDTWLSLGIKAQYRGIYFGAFDVSSDDFTGGNGQVKEGFLHDVAALANLTLHTFY